LNINIPIENFGNLQEIGGIFELVENKLTEKQDELLRKTSQLEQLKNAFDKVRAIQKNLAE
jgi:hypothetical protein